MRRQLKRSVSLLFATYTISHLILHMLIMAVEVFFSQVFPLFLSYSLRGYFILLFILFFCLKSVFISHKLLILLCFFSPGFSCILLPQQHIYRDSFYDCMLSMHCLVMYFCSTLFLLFSFPFIIKLTVIHSFCFCCFCRLPKNVVSMCVRMLMVFFGNIYFFDGILHRNNPLLLALHLA